MLATADTEEITTETQCLAPAVDRESEAKLSSEIATLWSAHQDGKATAKAHPARVEGASPQSRRAAPYHEGPSGSHRSGWPVDVLSEGPVHSAHLGRQVGTRTRGEPEPRLHKTPHWGNSRADRGRREEVLPAPVAAPPEHADDLRRGVLLRPRDALQASELQQ